MAGPTSEDPHRPDLPALATDGPISYAIVHLAKAHRTAAAGLFRSVGIHPGQELLLMQLWYRDGRTQAELVRALGVDASTVTRMVARLDQNGLVRRTASTTDRRAVVVSLTPRGAALRDDVRRMWRELEATTTGGMSAQDRSELLGGLQDMHRRLTGTPD